MKRNSNFVRYAIVGIDEENRVQPLYFSLTGESYLNVFCKSLKFRFRRRFRRYYHDIKIVNMINLFYEDYETYN